MFLLFNHFRWVIYKLPHDNDSDSKWIKEGTGYLYLDSENSGKFILPDKSINDSRSSAGHTLSQIYNSSPESVGYAMYNDEEPDETKDFMRAHSKGVVSYDSSSGFWLVHSVPKYPPYSNSSYSYPWSGTVYGQSMLCMSLPLIGINKAGRQFQTNGPHFYNYSMPESLQSQLQDLYDATKYNKTVNGTDFNIEMLITTGGNDFTSFAKSEFFEKDLYASLVSLTLKKPLLVESWVRGDVVPSCCPPSPNCSYDVYDVETLSFGGIMNFTEKQDHSKWAVADDKSTLCIGDINRMVSSPLSIGLFY